MQKHRINIWKSSIIPIYASLVVPLWFGRYRSDWTQVQNCLAWCIRDICWCIMTSDFKKIHTSHLLLLTMSKWRKSTIAGYLTAEKKSFHDITDRLMNVNLEVLSDLTKRMTEERESSLKLKKKSCASNWSMTWIMSMSCAWVNHSEKIYEKWNLVFNLILWCTIMVYNLFSCW